MSGPHSSVCTGFPPSVPCFLCPLHAATRGRPRSPPYSESPPFCLEAPQDPLSDPTSSPCPCCPLCSSSSPSASRTLHWLFPQAPYDSVLTSFRSVLMCRLLRHIFAPLSLLCFLIVYLPLEKLYIEKFIGIEFVEHSIHPFKEYNSMACDIFNSF